MDCVFSVIVIGILVILVWRSLWVLFDLVIYPDDLATSAWYSVVSTFSFQTDKSIASVSKAELFEFLAIYQFWFFSDLICLFN